MENNYSEDGFNRREYANDVDSSIDEDLEDSTDENDISDNSLFSITSYGADFSLRELSTMMEDEDLLVPKIQRHFVWSKRIASRFVETILFGLPVPSIFLSSNEDGTYLIVDGLQRLTTINAFINGVYPADDSVFKLSSSVNEKWANKTFSQLNIADQRRFKITTLHSIIFQQNEPKHDDTSLFQIFERINTGGVRLSPQEIRNSIYQNYINDIIVELNEHPSWRKIFGSEKLNPRMRDVEYVLRFFWEFTVKKNGSFADDLSVNVKKELNLFMDFESDRYNHDKSYIQELANLFEKTMNYLSSISKDPFMLESKKTLDPILFDSFSIAVAMYIKKYGKVPALTEEEFSSRKIQFIKSSEYSLIIENTRRPTYGSILKRSQVADKYLFGDKY